MNAIRQSRRAVRYARFSPAAITAALSVPWGCAERSCVSEAVPKGLGSNRARSAAQAEPSPLWLDDFITASIFSVNAAGEKGFSK